MTHGNLFNTGTITRFLIEEQRRLNTDAGLSSPTGSVTALVNDVRLACKRIATLIGKGSARSGERAKRRFGLELPPGTASDAPDEGAPVNLTALANEIFVRTNEWGGQLAGMLSRERDEPYGIPQAYPRGVYLLLFDPLDGSSNIDVNDSVGSIFSVLKCPDGVGDPRHADFLQPGSAQVCAGYSIYGPATMLVLSTGRGVNGFTLDREIGEFMLTHPNLRVPQGTEELAINASNSRHWEPAVRRYVNECMAGRSGPRGTDFNMRWIASLVAETHRILMRGGVFLYPRDRKDPPGAARLRLLYEANPIGYLIEQAGGRASTGYGPLLDVLPESLHGCTSLVFGARGEVERIERYHRDHNEFELDVPLFAARGLFTTHT